MRNLIIKFRTFLLRHFKNEKMQKLIYGLISYEMISYIFFGIGTSVVDYVIFTILNAAKMNSLITNIISSGCAILFAYVTNKLWVFRSKTNGIAEIFREFCKFTYARLLTLAISEIILLVSQLFYGNDQLANQVAKLIAMVFTVILNYIFSKLFIFKERKGTKNENK